MSLDIFNLSIDRFKFPGGEVHVRVESLAGETGVQIRALIRDSDDIMAMLMATDAVRRFGAQTVDLAMPYVPYARQDRVAVPGEPLSIKVFCDLVNSQKYRKVVIHDPHSDVTPALLDNCVVISQEQILSSYSSKIFSEFPGFRENREHFTLVCPDAGARKKFYKVSERLGITSVIMGDKVRDVRTGKIMGTTVNGALEGIGHWNHNADLLIVDDICDGGATFIQLAGALRRFGHRGSINLYVTHGIFSKGFEVFDNVLDRIFVMNSWKSRGEITMQNDRFNVYKSQIDGGKDLQAIQALKPCRIIQLE